MRGLVLSCLLPFVLVSAGLGQSSDELIRRLKDPDIRTRRLAAEALGNQKVESAAPDLAELLKDREASVRKAAADALLRIGPKGVLGLAGALSFPDEASRLEAVTALRRGGPAAKEAVPPLTAALKDKTVNVRIRAAMALGNLGADAKSALPALIEATKDLGNMGGRIAPDQPSGVPEAAITAALAIDPKCGEQIAKTALADLTAALKSKDWVEVNTAANGLAALGPHAKPAIPTLREVHKGSTPLTSIALERALKAVDGLTFALDLIVDDKAPALSRMDALWNLGLSEQIDERAIPALTRAMKDANPDVRKVAVDAAGYLGPAAKATIPTLLELLGDEKLENKSEGDQGPPFHHAVRALTRIGADAVPALVELVKEEAKPSAVRTNAARSLRGLGRRAASALPVLETAMKDKGTALAIESACAYLRAGGDPAKAIPVLKAGLESDSPAIIRTTVLGLGGVWRQAKDLILVLVPLLEHKDHDVRFRTALVLSRMGRDAAPGVAGIAKLLKEKDKGDRYSAAVLLMRLGPDARAAVPQLTESLGVPEDIVTRSALLECLARIGPDARECVPTLLELLKKRPDAYGNLLIDVLGRIGPEAKPAVPQLLAILNRNGELTQEAILALGQIGPDASEAVPALKKQMDAESKATRILSAFALARITGDTKTYVPMLVEWWKENEGAGFVGSTRPVLARVFGLLGAESRPARDLLLEAFLDPKTVVGMRSPIAQALGRMSEDADVIVPRLMEILEKPTKVIDRRWRYGPAIEALSLLGPKAKEAAPALRRLLDDEDDERADAAARALERIEGRP